MKLYYKIYLLAVVTGALLGDTLGMNGFVYLGPAQPYVNKSSKVVVQKFYWRSTTTLNWIEAYESCRTQGGILASPLNPLQDDDLRNYLLIDNFGGSVWIGARQTSSCWNWVAIDIPVGFTNWRTTSCSTTSNYCAFVSGATTLYNWCSAACTSNQFYVCEV